ncbi:hypothetical protein DSO57_1032009 [Entomophthora muscae]|uniref:Uncharacterized protein n=1 Tax=Entomophthora muscae TaxID=34485 RepID=A0ACC2TMR8_9FUNG|nr:hypothetical protein DSO57_1032009 [Entomophthora muscae]
MSNNQRNSWSGRGNPPYSGYQYNASESASHNHPPQLPPVNFLPIQPGPPPPQERQPLPPIHQSYSTHHIPTIPPPHTQDRPFRQAIHQPILSQLSQSVPQEGSEAQHSTRVTSQGGSPDSSSAGGRPLNVRDALTYLDKVKLEFDGQPEIYNRFLDIMKDFKSQAIDTPGVIQRVSELFRGYPTLVFGFNTFLPPGFRIELSSDPSDPNGVRVIVPEVAPTLPPVDVDHYNNHPSGSTSNHPVYQLPPPVDISTRPSQAPHYYPTSAYPRSEDPHAMPPPLHHPSANPASHRKQPVEFNHAINYVNRIKNRFAREPDNYKQFLDILQMYQKEQKPIKEIYAQVQTLFGSDTELLEEFCQFLPDPALSSTEPSNSLSRPSASHYPNLPAHPPHGISLPPLSATSSRSYPSHHPGHGPPISAHASSSKHVAKFPPVSDIAPPSHYGTHAGVHDMHTPRIPQSGVPKPEAPLLGPVLASPSLINSSKKKRIFGDKASTQAKTKKPKANLAKSKDDLDVNHVEQQEAYEAQFAKHAAILAPPETFEKFVKIKKHINHLPTYHEFLKVLSLHSQGVIEVDCLVATVESFIGGHGELFNWFKDFVGFSSKPEPTPAVFGIPKPKIDLNKLQRVGPSYRLLPKSETQSVCSGRDDLCNEVLNDVFVSHPTWASEDSVFVAPKKNIYEESLHKVEEERFELDFNLETNFHTLKLMDSLAKKIAKMSPEEQAAFRLPLGLGEHSITIYKRAIYKLYDTEAPEVFELLHSSPASAIPVILRRLKQKDLEWRENKKEWGKLWRETDSKHYYRSLDYQVTQFKGSDRKYLTTRQFTAEIEAVKREREATNAPAAMLGNPHLNFNMPDKLLHKDVGRLMMCILNTSVAFTPAERSKIIVFIRGFIYDLFGISIMEDAELADDPKLKDIEPVNKKRRTGPAIIPPEPGLPKEEDFPKPLADPTSWEQLVLDPNTGVAVSFRHPAHVLLLCNQHVYAILRLYQTLYARLETIKAKAPQAHIRFLNLANRKCPAKELDLLPKIAALPGVDLATMDCYEEFLKLTERVITGDLDQPIYEDSLRMMFGNHVYCTFTLDKNLLAICKQVNILFMDNNRNSLELVQQFRSQRLTPGGMCTATNLTKYRQAILNYIKNDETIYLIEYSKLEKSLAFQLFDPTELGADYFMALEKNWAAYCASFSADAPTDNVLPQRPSFLKRSLSNSQSTDNVKFFPALKPGICATSFKIRWPCSVQQESIVRSNCPIADDHSRAVRQSRWSELLDGPAGWSRNINNPSKVESAFRHWFSGKAKAKRDRVAPDDEPSQTL